MNSRSDKFSEIQSMITVEYLAIVQKSNTFCDSVPSFNRLIQVDSSIVIKSQKIIFKNKFSCEYKITSGEIKDKDQRYFHLHFSISDESTEQLDNFSEFLKAIRSVLAKLESQPETLWDDISLHYSNLSYSVIHNIENLMRKLIANFMLITVGFEWVAETSPAEVKAVISKAKRKDYLNALHNVDFKDLADFLLRPYSAIPSEELNKKIRQAADFEEVKQIKKLMPQSNWSRYFSNLVACDDTFLQKRWMDLYELRCKVAHNALVTKEDFSKISELAMELKDKLLEAINKLPQVQVPSEEVALVSENAAASGNASIGNFILSWKKLEQVILDTSKAAEGRSIRELIDRGTPHMKLTLADRSACLHLYRMRTEMLHRSDVEYSDSEIHDALKLMLILTYKLCRDYGNGDLNSELPIEP